MDYKNAFVSQTIGDPFDVYQKITQSHPVHFTTCLLNRTLNHNLIYFHMIFLGSFWRYTFFLWLQAIGLKFYLPEEYFDA